MSLRLSLVVCGVLLLPGMLRAQQSARKTYHDYPVGYLEYLPPGYDSGSEKYPVIIFLHGGGENGDGSPESLKNVKAWGPPSFLDNFDLCFTVDGHRQCFIVLSPQLNPFLYDWRTTVDRLLDHLQNGPVAYHIDPDRIYLTGLSRGGKAVYEYAASHYNANNKLAAIAPVAAWSENPLEGCLISKRKISLWAFHGQKDTVIPHSLGLSAFRKVQNCNDPSPSADLHFTTYPDRYHDSWIPAYDASGAIHSPNLYEWFLTQKRRPPDPIDPVTSVHQGSASHSYSVHPNPALNKISIQFLNESPCAWSIAIAASSGQVVLERGARNIIDISTLPAGVYLIRLTSCDNTTVTRRFVKMN